MRLLLVALCLLAVVGLSAAADCAKIKKCTSQLLSWKRKSKGGCVSAMQTVVGAKPDGDFGPKTDKAVRAYQKSKGLKQDGIVGPKTWAAIVRANCAATPVPPSVPSRNGYFYTSASCVGQVTPFSPGAQSDIAASKKRYGSISPGITDKIKASGWRGNAAAQVAAARLPYPNAAIALGRFIGNSGDFLTFSGQDMVTESTHANDCFIRDINRLRDAAAVLVPPGQTRCLTTISEFTGSASTNACNSARPNGVSKTARKDFDWHAAVGAYRVAISATVTSGRGSQYTGTITYSIRDLYDWDANDKGHVGLVTPNQMFALHVWGWARDFQQGGSYTFTQTWSTDDRLSFRK